MSDFPNRLKKLRTDSHLTQKQLAEQLNVSQNAVYNWENGKREPNLDMMKKIAKVFDIALYILLDDNYELPNITSDAWKKRARFSGDTEMEKPPRFTAPENNEYFKENDSSTIKVLDENYFNHLLQKEERGQKLTPEEKSYKTFFLGETLRGIGNKFAEYYFMLNEEGQKKADMEINRTLEFLMLISQVPEYQKEKEK